MRPSSSSSLRSHAVRLLRSPRVAPARHALVVFALLVAPGACATKTNPYVDAPGTGDLGQLDLTASNAGQVVALHGTVDLTVDKREHLEHPECEHGGCDGGSCTDGARSIPISSTVTCDDGACDVAPVDDGFRITPKREGKIVLHVHADATDRNQAWDDTMKIEAARADGIEVDHAALVDADGVHHAVLPGAESTWCAVPYHAVAADAQAGQSGHERLYSSTAILQMDLPTNLVDIVAFPYEAASSAGTYDPWGSQGGPFGVGVTTCATFRARAVGTGQVVARGPEGLTRSVPFRVADPSHVIGAEVHATVPADSNGGPVFRDVSFDEIVPGALATITSAPGDDPSLSAYAVVLRLDDGGTALGGVSHLQIDPAWIATLRAVATTYALPSKGDALFDVVPCVGEVDVPLDGGAPGTNAADASLDGAPTGDAALANDAGVDAATAPPGADAGPIDPDASAPQGHVVYDCQPGTARLHGDLWGNDLDVPVIIPPS